MESFNETFNRIFTGCGLGEYAAEGYAAKFEKLTAMLLDAGTRMNLTAIKEPEEIILKHYADSLLPAHLLPRDARLLDVGCGGGFPTLPLAIVRPDLTVTALDATAKKLTFVDAAAKELSLNVRTLSGRAEELGRDPAHREKYDAVTARAVAELSVLCEWCLPFVRVGGVFLALKGAGGKDELAAARNAIATLGGQVETVEERPLGDAARVNILIKKTAPTPQAYPRKNAQIKKAPL